jgi:hypothetical protein
MGGDDDRPRHGDEQLLKSFFEVSWMMIQLMVTKQLLKSFFDKTIFEKFF